MLIQSTDVESGNSYDGTWNLSQNVNGIKTLTSYYIENIDVPWISSGATLGIYFYCPQTTIDGSHPYAQYLVNFSTQTSADTTTIAAQFQTDIRAATLTSSQWLTEYVDNMILLSQTTVTYNSGAGTYDIEFTYIGGGGGTNVQITLQYASNCNCTSILGSPTIDTLITVNNSSSTATFSWTVADGEIGNNDPQYMYVTFSNVVSSYPTSNSGSPTLILDRWTNYSGPTIRINGQVKTFDIYWSLPSAPTSPVAFTGGWGLLFI